MALKRTRETFPRTPRGPAGAGSRRGGVELLQQSVGGSLDFLVPPLGRAVEAGDQATSVQAAKVAVHERVSRLGLVGGALGQPEEPARVLLPRVFLQEGVLVAGLRLDVAPVAVQHVTPGLDELASPGDAAPVHGVGSHEPPHTRSRVVRSERRTACSVCRVTRFVVDGETLLRIAAGEIEVAGEHQLVAPTLVRSQALSALYEAARSGEISAAEGIERVTRINSLKVRFLGDKVLQRQAWKVADQLGWETTYEAEYVALTTLQADVFVTSDPDLARAVSSLVETATPDGLSRH